MTALPTLNMVGWSILDYELALDGIRMVNDATVCIQNQPRASSGNNYHPGAAFVADLGEDWCSSIIGELIDSLRVIRYDDLGDEDRRIRLLIHYESDFGSAGTPVAQILQMILVQQARAA